MVENSRFKSYIASLARLHDYYGDYKISDRQAWRKRTEDCYTSGYHKSCDGKWYYRFKARKTNDLRNKWHVQDLVSGNTSVCATFAECRIWAEKMSENLSRYVKEVYQPGMCAFTPDGVLVRIDAVEAGGKDPCSVWYSRDTELEGPQEKLIDVTCLYLDYQTAEDGFADWLRSVSLDSGVFDRVGEDEVRKKYRKLTEILISRSLTVSTMESASGGQIASLFTDTEGSSAVLKGAFVTYSNDAKVMQGVPKEVIDRFSVYSIETAAAMAKACRETYDADYGIGVTGTTGNTDPANTEYSVTGQVYLAVARRNGATVTKMIELCERKDRYMYKIYIADEVFDLLMDIIMEEDASHKTKTVYVRTYPHATQSAQLVIPEDLSPEEERKYIALHLAEAEFAKPDLDYAGADFTYYETAQDRDN